MLDAFNEILLSTADTRMSSQQCDKVHKIFANPSQAKSQRGKGGEVHLKFHR